MPTTCRLFETPKTSHPDASPRRFASLLSAETYSPVLSAENWRAASLNSTTSFSQPASSRSRSSVSSTFVRVMSFLR